MFNKIINFIKNIIAPKKCYQCGEIGYFICPNCFHKLDNHKSYCYICKKSSLNFEIHNSCESKNLFLSKIIVLTHYKSSIIKKLIKNAKYNGKKDILEDFSIYLSELLLKNINSKNLDEYIIIPRPMFFIKKLFRGYNQADILAYNISKITNIKYQKNLLYKLKYTKSQSKLDRKSRLLNLQNSFGINKKKIKNLRQKKIIIVDDVISTGSTLNEMRKILKENGFFEIVGLAIASD